MATKAFKKLPARAKRAAFAAMAAEGKVKKKKAAASTAKKKAKRRIDTAAKTKKKASKGLDAYRNLPEWSPLNTKASVPQRRRALGVKYD